MPLVFCTGDAAWDTPVHLWEQMDLPEDLRRFVPGRETLRLNVKQSDPELLVRLPSVVGWALRVIQQERGTFEDFELTVREALAGIEDLPGLHTGQWLRAIWYLLLFSFHRRGSGEYNELEREIRASAHRSPFYDREEGEVMAMTMAEVCEARGAARALRNALIRLLEVKFGAITTDLRIRIETADTDTLGRWIESTGLASTLDQVGIGSA